MVTKEPMDTLIANTTMQKMLSDGVHTGYEITPNEGYVLHDKGRDWTEPNWETMEDELHLGYTRGSASCRVNYDFEANPREFYAVLESEVPADHIFGNVGNKPEIM